MKLSASAKFTDRAVGGAEARTVSVDCDVLTDQDVSEQASGSGIEHNEFSEIGDKKSC